MIDKIEEFINAEIRPYILSHGGDISIVSLEEGVLRIRLTGQCMTCPEAQTTFEDIISQKILPAFPRLKNVLLVNDVPEDMLDFARKLLNHEK